MNVVVRNFTGRAGQRYVDGFGERRVIVDARGQRLEILQVSAPLSSAPSFEHALRERVRRVSTFRNESFSRVRDVETDTATGALLVVSDHVPGVRLSTLLDTAEARSVDVELRVVTCVIRQLLQAIVAWHERMPDISHGAIGPDRIVVTPDGRVVLVEHVFGSALEHLRYSRQRYWKELGVALPAAFEDTIDASADVVQAGAVTQAMLLGRRLNEGDRLDGIDPAVEVRLTPPLRSWMARALQLEPIRSFESVLDAAPAFDEAVGAVKRTEERERLLRFMARCTVGGIGRHAAVTGDRPGAATTARTLSPPGELPHADVASRIEALKGFLARPSARADRPLDPAGPVVADDVEPHARSTGTRSAPAVQKRPTRDLFHSLKALLSRRSAPTEPVKREGDAATHQAQSSMATVTTSPEPRVPGPDWTRLAWIAGATAVAVGAGLLLLVLGIAPWPSAPATGALSIVTRPPGVAVAIDGTARGVTPLAIKLTAGNHLVELITSSERRQVPVTIRAGSDSSQFLEMTGGAARATSSELRVRTEPLAAAVTVDGRFVGRSPVSVGDLSPGAHTVVLEHEAGSATEQVLIEEGKTASLFVPLASRSGAGAGWISIAKAPGDVQIFENGRLLGSSQIERIMLPAGRHELDIVNETLGYQEHRVVRITGGQTATINVSWPSGRLSINAVPWAQAYVDGLPAGETPIANIELPVGEHEVVFRHPQLGERRTSVTVTTRETAKVGVDLRAR